MGEGRRRGSRVASALGGGWKRVVPVYLRYISGKPPVYLRCTSGVSRLFVLCNLVRTSAALRRLHRVRRQRFEATALRGRTERVEPRQEWQTRVNPVWSRPIARGEHGTNKYLL